MQRFSEVAPHYSYSNRKQSFKTNSNSYSYQDSDDLYDMLADVTNRDESYKKYYLSRFNKLGRDKVLQLAAQARSDASTSPQRLFGFLLNHHYKKVA